VRRELRLLFDPVDLMSGNIVQKDDLSLLQSWSKDLFDIGQEGGVRPSGPSSTTGP